MINLPVISAFAGLTVGCTPWLKGLLVGRAAPLGFVMHSLEVQSSCLLHITLCFTGDLEQLLHG